MSRRIAARAVVAALAGCAPGVNDDLRALVEGVVPADRETAECEWGFGTGPDEYGCIYLVRGAFASVKRSVLAKLAQEGFVSACHAGGKRFKIEAVRVDSMIAVDVVAGKLVLPRNVNYSDEGYEIPAGYVAVDIRADEGANMSESITIESPI